MTVDYAIAIATLSNWLKRVAPVFQPIRSKTRALSKLEVIARNSDWFIALFAPVMIDRRSYFGSVFLTVIWKPLYEF